MRLVVAGLSALSAALLSGCVDPAHSRFANKGACEVSVGSHMCTGDDDSRALSANGDPDLHQFAGSHAGGSGN